eukprot:5287294-Alexandrium_andersonii.AAC.1
MKGGPFKLDAPSAVVQDASVVKEKAEAIFKVWPPWASEVHHQGKAGALESSRLQPFLNLPGE